jgi:putative oxidoreductase
VKKIIQTIHYPGLIIRITVGLIFLSEGVQKFIFPATMGSGRFESLGIHPSAFWADFTGCFEILCAGMILFGFLIRLAVIPLLIVMLVAFFTTKWSILIEKGFWPMLHDGRTDFAMTTLLIFLLIYGSGNNSLDMTYYAKSKR